jgi:hypothetical protein
MEIEKKISQPKPGSKEASVRALREAEAKAGNPDVPTFLARKTDTQNALRLQMIRDAAEQRRRVRSPDDDRTIPSNPVRSNGPTPPSTSPAKPKAGSVRADTTKETAVTKKAKKTKVQKSPRPRARKGARKATARATAARRAKGTVRPGSKLAAIVGLLQRPEGCTADEVRKATGWPSVSMPQQAKAAGITLAIEKQGKVNHYRDAAIKS